MTGAVLAGGDSKRMGCNKAFIELDGIRLIDRTIAVFKNIFKEVLVITNDPVTYEYLDVRVVKDLFSQKSSIVGIYTGLFYATYGHTLFVACDMPFIQEDIVRLLVENIGDNDVVIPETPDGLEPLFSVYSKRCLRPIFDLIKSEDYKIRNFFNRVKVKKISECEIKGEERGLSAFFNLNTKEDLEKINDKDIRISLASRDN
ncbi:MAG: molybdenum cofactor guanylyltransferase [Thermodesulfobacteriota bacterium]|nr:molybdenum cofactor guanylyltransferase [Thermodesulfobacteriota bacterium]